MRIRWHSPNVYVISTDDSASVRRFFEALGLSFVDEKHGNGPAHVSCERSGWVLEIYPERGHIGTDEGREPASSRDPCDPVR